MAVTELSPYELQYKWEVQDGFFRISILVFFISVGEVKWGQDGLGNNVDGIYISLVSIFHKESC